MRHTRKSADPPRPDPLDEVGWLANRLLAHAQALMDKINEVRREEGLALPLAPDLPNREE